MPTKTGGQGYVEENYDSSTGQYIKGSGAEKKDEESKKDASPSFQYKVDPSKVQNALALLRSKATANVQQPSVKKMAFEMSDEECDAEIPSLLSELKSGGVFSFADDPATIFPNKQFLVSNLRGLAEVQKNTTLKNVTVRLSDFGGNAGIIGQNDHETWNDAKGWEHTILLSTHFYGRGLSPTGFIRGQKTDAKVFFSVEKGNDQNYAAGPFIHECGHAVEGELISVMSPSQNTIYTQVSNQIQNEICSLAEQGDPDPRHLYAKYYPRGAYGNTNSKEFFAETFSSLFGGNPNPYALALKKILEKYKIWKGQ